MATKNNPGDYDCYANADPDEPMFILLARDRHAPALVWLWAVLRELDNEDPAKVEEARRTITAMIEWAAARGRSSVGLGQTALAAVMELIRAANARVDHSANAPTGAAQIRAFLAQTEKP